MLIRSDGFRYRLPSETRIAVCPIPGPVFVLGFSADHFSSAGGSVSACGVVTSTTLEGDEAPDAFHARTR